MAQSKDFFYFNCTTIYSNANRYTCQHFKSEYLCPGEYRFRLVSDFHLATNLHTNEYWVNVYPNYPQVTPLGGFKQLIHKWI